MSPSTLRSWERRYGFPRPLRSPGGHRQYALAELEALRRALADTHNVSSAVIVARQRGEGPTSAERLASALRDFDESAANRLLDESLVLRSIERTIEDPLLEGLKILAREGQSSPEYQFAWRYAAAWLAALGRLAPPVRRPQGVLLLDASAPLELDALHAQALEVVLRRAGLRTLSLVPTLDPSRIGRALRILRPAAIVLSGRWISLDVAGRIVYAVRTLRQPPAVFDFRGPTPETGATTVVRLDQAPLVACEGLLERLERHVPEEASTRPPAALAVG